MSKRIARPVSIKSQSGVPLWLKLVGGTVGLLVGAHFYLIHQINQFADGLVQGASLFAAASHRGGYYTWDGNLGIRKFRIESVTGGPSGLAVDELELETPGWWWVLQLANPLESRTQRLTRAFSPLAGGRGGALLPSTDHLYLRMRNIELDINDLVPPGLPDVGFSSGAPFETEGCPNVRYFVPLQLQQDLLLRYRKTDFSFGFRVSGPAQVTLSAEIDAPGAMNSRFEVDWTTDEPQHFLEADGDGERPTAMRWVLSDLGFTEARNTWCAEQAKVDADEFQRRHITTVRRVLEVYGVRMAPETESVYSEFSSSGGTLTLEATWPAEVSTELFASYPAQQQWQVMNPQIWHDDDAPLPLALEFVAARPLPSAYAGSVYDLLVRNADVGAAASESPLAQLGDQVRAFSAPATDAQAPEAPADAPAQNEPAKPNAAPAWQRPARVLPTPIALDTASLIAAIGERVSIETDDGRSRVGTLTVVSPKTVTIRVRISGGKADLDFTRERIRAVVANP